MAIRILRRRDGLLEIRPRRAHEIVVTYDTGVLLALMAGWVLFSAVVFALLVVAPLLLVMTGTFTLLGALSGAFACSPKPLATPPIEPPPRRVA